MSYRRLSVLAACCFIPVFGTQALGQVRLMGISGNQENKNQVDDPDATLFEVDLTTAAITQIQKLTFLPDTDTIGFNPNDGLIYTCRSDSLPSLALSN